MSKMSSKHKRLRKRKAYFEARRSGSIKAIHPMTGNIIDVDYQRDAQIGDDLDEALVRLPGTLSWYLSLRDTAKDAFKDAMHEEHNIEEDLNLEYRREAEEGGSAVKETEIKTRVKADPRMREAYRKRMDADAMLRKLESAVEAIIEKKWAIKSIVELRKIEMNIKDSD